jgi:hypothetical protein
MGEEHGETAFCEPEEILDVDSEDNYEEEKESMDE